MSTRAIILVDLQCGYADESDLVAPLARRAARFAKAAAAQGAFVIATQFHNEPGSVYERLIGDDMRGAPDTDLLPDVAGVAHVTIRKTGYAASTAGLSRELRARDIAEVYVVGVDTDQCVLATVFGLFDAGFEPYAVSDLCAATSGVTCHDAGIVALNRSLGEERVLTSEQAARHFQPEPSTMRS